MGRSSGPPEFRTNQIWGGRSPSITPHISCSLEAQHRQDMSIQGNGKYWVYTWNNPNVPVDDHHASFSAINPHFHVFQREVGENGTEHFQGYVELQAAKGVRQLKACNPQIHWEKRRGNQAQAIAYSSKEDTRKEGPWTFGEPVHLNNTGVSKDFAENVRAGKRMRELHDTHPDDMRKYPRYYENLRSVFSPPERDTAPEVVLLFGEPGTGKTRYVRSKEVKHDLYVKPCDRDFWMNGYDLHPAVLLDDFCGAANHVTLTNLLQLLDRYQIQVSSKNGHLWWQPERIYITTNIHPAKWYEYKDRVVHYAALERRFTKVIMFDNAVEHAAGMDRENFAHRAAWDSFWDYDSHKAQDTY
ncbi:putative replication protein [uncultured virus]|uniref:ATP-dependent helicase Rep n=1 Tax=uncultured virus TaxID=340016 RepID=A0A1I9XGE6_9VIRU|nr:putative replication protein [uncultured virus]